MSGAAAVEAKDELVQVELQVLTALAMVDAQGPELEVREDPMGPGEHDMGGHRADDVRMVGDAGYARRNPSSHRSSSSGTLSRNDPHDVELSITSPKRPPLRSDPKRLSLVLPIIALERKGHCA